MLTFNILPSQMPSFSMYPFAQTHLFPLQRAFDWHFLSSHLTEKNPKNTDITVFILINIRIKNGGNNIYVNDSGLKRICMRLSPTFAYSRNVHKSRHTRTFVVDTMCIR